MSRTITNPAENSSIDSSVIRNELQLLEDEIANLSTGHSHDGVDSKLISSTPGGSDTQVQFNDGGAFGGITGATTDGTELTLSEDLNISDGGIKIPTDNFTYATPPIKFTHPDMTDAESSKGGIIEWGGVMDGASHAYGLATKAYFDNASATFTAPSGYKKWAWITTHYDSPVSTGEPIHQHLNFETVQADWDTAVTRLQISFGEDTSLVSFPNSHVQVYNDKNFYIGTPTNNAYFVFSTSDDRLNVYGKDWNFASAQNVKIGASGAAGAKLHTENASDGTILLVRNTNGSGNNVPMLLLETQTATSRILQGGVQSDANKRISILANGQMEWGDGTAARDTNLYRTAADVLKTDDSFVVASKVAIGQTSLDTSKMLSVVTDGTVNGIQARASALGTASTAVLSLETQDVTKRALDFRLTGDSVSRLRLDANASSSGQITFGNGTSADTNLYRSAADTLKTDDALVVTGTLTASGTLELGNASDTTLSRVSAGVVAVEGKNVALNGTSETFTTGTIELGAASDTTIARSDAGVMTVEGVVVQTNQNARRTFYVYDDYVNNVNTPDFLFDGTGSSGTLAVTDASGIGLLTLNTGSGTTNRQGHWSSNVTALYFDTTATWTYETRIQVPTLSDGTDTYQILAGFRDVNNAEAVDGAYFSYIHSANSGKFELVTSSNSVRTRTDSGITVAINTWYVLKVVVLNVSGTLTARFYINDTQVGGDITSNLPSTTARATGYGIHIVKSAGTNSRYVLVDYTEVSGHFGAKR